MNSQLSVKKGITNVHMWCMFQALLKDVKMDHTGMSNKHKVSYVDWDMTHWRPNITITSLSHLPGCSVSMSLSKGKDLEDGALWYKPFDLGLDDAH